MKYKILCALAASSVILGCGKKVGEAVALAGDSTATTLSDAVTLSTAATP